MQTATTAREIITTRTDRNGVAVETRRFPAGTEVYATERRDGTFTVRVPGTRYRQNVTVATLLVP